MYMNDGNATHDFMLYTATNLICTLGGNIALNGYVKKHYPYIYV